MKLRLQRHEGPHLQDFPPCEYQGDLFKVVSAALGREALHLQTLATFRSKPHE
jgi:hypothetical protein